jgi:hypothetical protein
MNAEFKRKYVCIVAVRIFSDSRQLLSRSPRNCRSSPVVGIKSGISAVRVLVEFSLRQGEDSDVSCPPGMTL